MYPHSAPEISPLAYENAWPSAARSVATAVAPDIACPWSGGKISYAYHFISISLALWESPSDFLKAFYSLPGIGQAAPYRLTDFGGSILDGHMLECAIFCTRLLDLLQDIETWPVKFKEMLITSQDFFLLDINDIEAAEK